MIRTTRPLASPFVVLLSPAIANGDIRLGIARHQRPGIMLRLQLQAPVQTIRRFACATFIQYSTSSD
jgi:hypothetical protein